MPFRDLREFLELLEKKEELLSLSGRPGKSGEDLSILLNAEQNQIWLEKY